MTLKFKFSGTLILSTLISFFSPLQSVFSKQYSLPAELPRRCEPVSSVLAFSGSPKAALLPPGTRDKCLRCTFQEVFLLIPLLSLPELAQMVLLTCESSPEVPPRPFHPPAVGPSWSAACLFPLSASRARTESTLPVSSV